MKIARKFTKVGQDPFATLQYEKRTSRINNPDGTVVFEMTDAEVPTTWSQLATDIMVSKYFRKAGVPQVDASGKPIRDEHGKPVTGPERSAKQVIHRLVGCWRHWGETHGYFDSTEDAQAFYDELAYMLIHQMCAPNSPQWFNTGLNWAYNITGPSQGHFYCDPKTGQLNASSDAYTHPQPHACFIQSVSDDLVNSGGIMDLWVREARLFKYGSGTGSNFSRLRGENEPLSGGGKSSGLMSFLKIGDRAAGAIKSGGTTRRAAKMCCLDLDHPDIESFVNWKVREEIKVAALAEGLKVLPKAQQDVAKKLGLKLDYDFNGEAYQTVSGQNSNNSIRIPNAFFKAVEADGQWQLKWRVSPKPCRSVKARDLWDQIAFAAWRCADPGVQFDDTINQWHTCPKSGRINASNPCVTGDTRVLTPGGVWRRIDQMIHLPARVVTNLDGQAVHEIDGAFPTGNKEVFELKTASGYSLKVTADHKLYTRQRGWVMARDLTAQDELQFLSSPATTTEIGDPSDARLFQVVGLLVSQKNSDVSAVHLENCLGAGRLSDAFVQYATDTWGERAYNDDYVDRIMLGDEDRGGTAVATFTNRRLISRVRAYVHGAGAARRLSDEAFTAGLAAQKHLLRGLFSADGEIAGGTICVSSTSLGLLQDVQLLLSGFGIMAAVRQAGQLATLAVDTRCIAAFAYHIGVLPGELWTRLQEAARAAAPAAGLEAYFDRFASFTWLGRRQVFDLTESVTSSFVANGMTVHNCSEYMFIDDTACNLASLNVLTFYNSQTSQFDIESYRHATRLWTIVLEVSVLMASFPSEEIAKLSYEFRTLGLGYANLGAMLMQAGIPYNSEKARAICAALSAVLTGESYATSAEMAKQLGAFPGYKANREDMLRVIRNHRRAAYNVTSDAAARKGLGDYEQLDIKPVGIDLSQFSDSDPLASTQLLRAAQETWDRALATGEKVGYRNAQVSVIAPTGTIGLLMDCDTTGVEPDFALVKFKKLAGGGYFKIANQSLKPALVHLGYGDSEILDIMKYVMGALSLADSPHINRVSLKAAGLTDAELAKIQNSLPGVFDLSMAFSPWSLGADAMKRLNIEESVWKAPGFNLLRRMGFIAQEINQANDMICGVGTVEGAPHLKVEHYAVFECANRCGKYGKLFIPVEGHIRMMAAAQPFITGAISKTINLPNEATIQDIKDAYWLSWSLGLKADALYRDGSKLSQPLNVKSDEDLEKAEADDEENVKAAQEEVAADVAKAAKLVAELASRPVPAAAPLVVEHERIVEKIIERVVERPLRHRLPDTRQAMTHKFDVAGHEGYLTVGLYEDGTPGEVFITMAKEGSTTGGLMDTIATLVSLSLQYGVPVESLVRKFEHVRFEPSGFTRNPDIPMAKSLVDYIFRWLAMEFIPGYRAQYSPKREKKTPGKTGDDNTQEPGGANGAGASPAKGGNGHGNRLTADQHAHDLVAVGSHVDPAGLQLVPMSDTISAMAAAAQADAPACDVCGSITVRSGTCYKCMNCGNSMGCS